MGQFPDGATGVTRGAGADGSELSAAGATQASARGVLNTALWLYRRWLEDWLGGGTASKDRHGFVSHPHVFLDDQVLRLPR